jgi:hypothetical protein
MGVDKIIPHFFIFYPIWIKFGTGDSHKMYYVIVSLVNIGVLQATLDSELSDYGEDRYKVLRDMITFIFGFFLLY